MNIHGIEMEQVPLLVALLSKGRPRGKRYAAEALRELSVGNARNQNEIVQLQAVPLLVALLRDGCNGAQEEVGC